MKVYFDNDGSYGQNAINIPVIANGKPIGFVSEVNQERVTCYLWDRFVDKDLRAFNMGTTEQDICSISIVNN